MDEDCGFILRVGLSILYLSYLKETARIFHSSKGNCVWEEFGYIVGWDCPMYICFSFWKQLVSSSPVTRELRV